MINRLIVLIKFMSYLMSAYFINIAIIYSFKSFFGLDGLWGAIPSLIPFPPFILLGLIIVWVITGKSIFDVM